MANAQPIVSAPAINPRRWYTVFALSIAAFVDSGENETLAILWPKMYAALRADVSQLGLVLGISDLIRTLTLPLWGWAADRFSRKSLLVWITGFWGLWTLAIALVQDLSQLFLVRIVASLGLGVLWPAAFSLLSDLFSSKERGRAAGVMTAVSFSGTLASFFILPTLANCPGRSATGAARHRARSARHDDRDRRLAGDDPQRAVSCFPGRQYHHHAVAHDPHSQAAGCVAVGADFPHLPGKPQGTAQFALGAAREAFRKIVD